MKLKHLLLTLLAMQASISTFAYDAEIDGIYYNFNGDEATVTNRDENDNQGNYSDAIVVIPESVTYDGKTYIVTGIDGYTFCWCTEITSITIPNSVTSIGEEAFTGCISLTSITIPNSVKSIGNSAFYCCYSLTSITIPESVTSIGGGILRECSGLTSIIVETGNQFYDSRENCNAIIETESNLMLAGCMNTFIPNGVTSIGESVFDCCGGLTSITIPESVTSIGRNAFGACRNLTSVNIPNSVTSIGDGAFYGCDNLTSLTIGNSVTFIGGGAFSGCRNLTSVNIPESVEFIGGNIFSGCSSLTSISVDPDNLFYDSRNDCNAIIETETNTLISGCQNTIIPNDVECIGYGAFYGQENLNTITIPESVISIGPQAFDTSGLTSITIPESVMEIRDYAFQSCNLTSIIIPDNVTSIGYAAFNWCI